MKVNRQWIDPDTGLEVDGVVEYHVPGTGWYVLGFVVVLALLVYFLS